MATHLELAVAFKRPRSPVSLLDTTEGMHVKTANALNQLDVSDAPDEKDHRRGERARRRVRVILERDNPGVAIASPQVHAVTEVLRKG